MNKNDEYVVEIKGYTSEGAGVARVDGFVVFVPFATKGEKVKIHIIKVSKTFAVGKIVEILEKSPKRVEPACPYFKRCGGCQLEHVSYNSALEIKRQIVIDALDKIGGFKNLDVKNAVKSDKIYNYRNKSAFPVALNGDAPSICMYKNLSHEPIFIKECLLSSELINRAIDVLNSNLESEAKFVVLREIENNLLLTIVASRKPSKLDNIIKGLAKLGFGQDNLGIYWCKKNLDNNVILEGEITHLYGREKIEYNFLGIDVEISPLSFFQVNLSVMQKLYVEAVKNFNKDDVVVDCYSGAGLMSCLIAKKVKKVYAIEIVKEATIDADKTKAKNNISNLENINGDTCQVLPRLAKNLRDFSVVLDPPRKGLDKRVVETLLSVEPKKIVYISCEPSSLARDLRMLAEKYKIESVQPFDMFPQTQHIETLVVLNKI